MVEETPDKTLAPHSTPENTPAPSDMACGENENTPATSDTACGGNEVATPSANSSPAPATPSANTDVVTTPSDSSAPTEISDNADVVTPEQHEAPTTPDQQEAPNTPTPPFGGERTTPRGSPDRPKAGESDPRKRKSPCNHGEVVGLMQMTPGWFTEEYYNNRAREDWPTECEKCKLEFVSRPGEIEPNQFKVTKKQSVWMCQNATCMGPSCNHALCQNCYDQLLMSECNSGRSKRHCKPNSRFRN